MSASKPTTDANAVTEDPLAGVPELRTFLATDEDTRIDALRLVADSVAQMRQTANSAVLFNPITIAVTVGVIAVYYQVMIRFNYDWITIMMSSSGWIMGVMALIRWITQPYLDAAEKLDLPWMGKDSSVWVTQFGDEVIGSIVVDWEPAAGGAKKPRKGAVVGKVKGWAVRLRYRGKGVGSALLEEAVKEAKRKGGVVEFAEDHANSIRVLPQLFNGIFDKRDRKLQARLEALLSADGSVNGSKTADKKK